MPKKQKTTPKTIKRLAHYFTVIMAILYGFYWAAMGIFDANTDWEDTVGNVLLVGIIFGAMTMGLMGAIGSIKKKSS